MNGRHGAAHTAALRRLSGAGNRRRDMRGMVTVELAVGFVTATVLAATLSAVVLLGVGQAACARTSSEVARQLARGDAVAARRAEQQGPAGSAVTVSRDAQGLEVRVTALVRVPGLGEVGLAAKSWAAWEPGVAGAARR